MRKVKKYLWKIRWAGRNTTTRAHFTEAEIRAQHPEAERIESSRIIVELPETSTEVAQALRPSRRQVDGAGRVTKLWEE